MSRARLAGVTLALAAGAAVVTPGAIGQEPQSPAGSESAPAQVSARSPVTGMRMAVEGARVTVSPGPRVSTTFMRSVQGRRVTVACVSGTRALIDMFAGEGLPTGPFDVGFLGGSKRWPAGERSLSFTLPRDVSRSVDGCFVGRNLELASVASFTPEARSLMAESLAEQRLVLAHATVQRIGRERGERRLPGARPLVRRIAASEPQLRVSYAPTLRDVRRRGVVYVIDAGTNATRIRMAARGDGDPAVRLTGGLRGGPEIRYSHLMPTFAG